MAAGDDANHRIDVTPKPLDLQLGSRQKITEEVGPLQTAEPRNIKMDVENVRLQF